MAGDVSRLPGHAYGIVVDSQQHPQMPLTVLGFEAGVIVSTMIAVAIVVAGHILWMLFHRMHRAGVATLIHGPPAPAHGHCSALMELGRMKRSHALSRIEPSAVPLAETARKRAVKAAQVEITPPKRTAAMLDPRFLRRSAQRKP